MPSTAPLSIGALFISLLFPLTVVGVSYYLRLGLEVKLLTAVCRSAVQLFLAGYVLLGFVFSMRQPVWVMSFLLMMIMIASLEVTSRQLRTYAGHFRDSVICVFASGGLIGLVGSILVFTPVPWWEPAVFVPAAGMLIGNSISGPALAVDRLLSDVSDKRHESETRLAFGATSFEAVLPSVRSALSAALMPLINQMSVVGLVSIPGMMAGQLLGGSAPMVAAEYQMAILWLICAVTAVSTLVATHLACYHAVFKDSRLTTERITKRESKVEVEVALFRAIVHFLATVPKLAETMRFGGFGSSRGSESAPVSSGEGVEMQAGQSYAKLSRAVESPSTHSMLHVSGDRSTAEVDVDIPSPPRFRAKAVWEEQLPFFSDIPAAVVLQVEGLDVMSGDCPLFGTSGLSFSLRPGEIVAFSGPSGIGKTRLLRALAQLDKPLSGRMGFSDFSVTPDAGGISDWRTRVLYVPQAVPPLSGTPKSFLQEAFGFASRSSASSVDIDSELARVAESVGLEASKMSDQWQSLSGGERQRACIALALILACSSPIKGMVLFDEPTAACDDESKTKVEAAIVSSGVGAILITHDSAQAKRISHKRVVVTLNDDDGDAVPL